MVYLFGFVGLFLLWGCRWCRCLDALGLHGEIYISSSLGILGSFGPWYSHR